MPAARLSFAAMADPGDTLADHPSESGRGDGPVELTIVTLQFDTADPAALLGVLSKYVVLTRMEPGCRNVDLCSSYTRPGRYLLIQKWESPAAQRRHFDSPVMVEMATNCNGLLTAPPEIDLWDGPSAHDLR
jgi:quinol monooxygenase YgiN